MLDMNARAGWNTIVLTGAAGRLGTVLRPVLAGRCKLLRSSDIAAVEPAFPGEEFIRADLQHRQEVAGLLAGADAVVHFGGIPEEDSFDRILPANIIGNYNIFEEARTAGVRRVIFASTNHVIGFQPSYQNLTADAPMLPDTLYAVSKAYGESLGALYAHKYGLEVACLRIGACWPAPRGDQRDLALWLSHGDLGRLVSACLDANSFDYEILYGCSDNTRKWWTNTSKRIAYNPQDNSEDYASAASAHPEAEEIAADPALRYQGGAFAAQGFSRPATAGDR
jgi:uronate dehydrogenase